MQRSTSKGDRTWRGAQPTRPRRPERRGLRAEPLEEATRGIGLLTRGLRFSISEGRASEETLARDSAYRRMLALADVAAVSLALAPVIAGFGGAMPSLWLLAALPLIVLVSKVVGAYDRDELVLHKNTLDETPLLFQLATLSVLLLVLLAPQLASFTPAPTEIAVFWASLTVLLVVTRSSARWLSRRYTAEERCLVVGDEGATRKVRRRMDESTRINARVVARLPFAPMRSQDRTQWAVDDIQELVERLRIHRVVVAPSGQENEEVLELIRISKALGLSVSVVPRVFEVVGSSVEFDDVDGVTVLGVRRFGLTQSSERLKRAFDLLVAGTATLIFAPVMLAAALAVRLDSRGPILFRQIRVGRDGKRFEVLKFRTMCVDAEAKKADLQHLNEADGLFKITDDPRITRVGRILRKTSLDELPQLLNVLRGEMSVVGPRPFIVEDDDKIQGWHRRRLHLTPGMTGHWQILGSNRIPLHEMVTIDYLYVANWSLWTDLKILLRTVPYVLSARSS